jgi:hypothetical protein
MRASCLPLVSAFVVASALQAGAQNLPWPSNPPPAGAAGSPAAMTPAPMGAPMGAPTPMMGAAPPQASPFGGGGAAGGPPPCVVEFGKLRDEVQKKGMAAKTAQEHKVAREEMCKVVQAYSAAEGKWLKFAEAGVASCGIPGEVVNQLKQVHARTEQARTNICSAGPAAAAPVAPSLSDALGTNRLQLDTKKTGANYLDTLTGNAIQR